MSTRLGSVRLTGPILSVVLVLGVAGCTADESTEPPPTSTDAPVATTTTSRPVTTAEAAAETTTVPEETTTTASAGPTPDTTGEDWNRIAQELRDFVAYMLENPDPALVPLYAVDGSPQADFYQGILTDYVEQGVRGLPGSAGTVVDATVESGSPEEGRVVLLMFWEDDGYTAVGPDGEIVLEEEPLGVTTYRWVLEGSVEAGWRVSESTYIGP